MYAALAASTGVLLFRVRISHVSGLDVRVSEYPNKWIDVRSVCMENLAHPLQNDCRKGRGIRCGEEGDLLLECVMRVAFVSYSPYSPAKKWIPRTNATMG